MKDETVVMVLLLSSKAFLKLIFCNFPEPITKLPKGMRDPMLRQVAYTWTEGYVIGLDNEAITFDDFENSKDYKHSACLEVYPWGMPYK